MGSSKPNHARMLRKTMTETWDRLKKGWRRIHIGFKGDTFTLMRQNADVKHATQPFVGVIPEVEVDINEQRQQKLDRLMEEIQQLTKDLTPEVELEEIPGASQSSDLEATRLRAHSGQCMAKVAEAQLKIEKLERMLERERDEHRKKEIDIESLAIAAKEENDKKALEHLESNLSCAVCKEVFIQATVIECGHTFCSFCINQCHTEWSKKTLKCPVCRNFSYQSRRAPIELENFITGMFESFNEEISNRNFL